jgi:hypothetical protein
VAERVILHVGPPKSGSTFLQTALWKNRDKLAVDGVLVPGRRQFDTNLLTKAIRDGRSLSGKARSPAPKALQRIVAEIGAWPATAVLSNEWFSHLSSSDAERIVDVVAPAQVHVVVTARAFVHQVPAAWQETLKVGRATSLGDFVLGLDRDSERWSWSTLDPSAVLARWRGSLPHQRIHVVTVPTPGSDPLSLWRRFASLAGVDADAYDAAGARLNPSLRVEGARLLQLLGPQLQAAVEVETGNRSEAHRWIRNYLGNSLLADAGSAPIGLDPKELAVVTRRSQAAADALRAAGYQIHGDLTEFTDAAQRPGARSPDSVSAEELLSVAGPLVCALLSRVRAETVRARTAEASLRKQVT